LPAASMLDDHKARRRLRVERTVCGDVVYAVFCPVARAYRKHERLEIAGCHPLGRTGPSKRPHWRHVKTVRLTCPAGDSMVCA
jgi:hypothetical protein